MPVEEGIRLRDMRSRDLQDRFPDAIVMPSTAIHKAELRKNRFEGIVRGAHRLTVTLDDGTERDWYVHSHQGATGLGGLLRSILHQRYHGPP